LVVADDHIARGAAALLGKVVPAVTGRHHHEAPPIDPATVREARALIELVTPVASRELQAALEEMGSHLEHFAGRTVAQGLAKAADGDRHRVGGDVDR
jgi:hypothetical protein